MFTKDFWKAALERAVKTVAQSAVAALGVGAAGLFQVDWQNIASIAGVAGVISVLTSIGSDAYNRSTGDATSGPSLANEITAPRHAAD